MVKVALFVRMEAKPGKEAEVESFLRSGLPIVEEIAGLFGGRLTLDTARSGRGLRVEIRFPAAA